MWRITADKGDNKLAHITFYYIVFVHVYQMLLVFGTKGFTSDQLNFLSRVLHLRPFQFLTDWSGKPVYSVDYPVQRAFTRQRALLGKQNQVWRQLSS